MGLLVGIGDFGLDEIRTQTLGARAEAIVAKEAAELAKEQAEELLSSDKVFNQPLYDQLQQQAYPDLEPDWHEVASAVTGSGSAGTYSTANRRITINSGASSAGTMLSQTIDLSSFGYKYGEKVVIRLFLKESAFGTINESILFRVFRGGTEVDVIPFASEMASLLLKVDIPYTVQMLSGETLTIKVEVASNAPNVSSTRTITWSGLSISNDKERFSTLTRKIADTLRKSDIMFATFDRNTTLYKGDVYAQVDEAERVTNEANEAIDKNGVYRIPKNAGILIGSSIPLSGAIEIVGGGPSSNLIARFSNAIFQSETDQRIVLKDFGFSRTDGIYFPTLILFSPDYLNKNTLIEGLRITNIPNPIIADNVDGLTINKVEFLGGQSGIQSGFNAPLNTKNVAYGNCVFDSVNLTAIEHRGTGSVDIIKNKFYTTSLIAECRRNIQLSLNGGNSPRVNIEGNHSTVFREHMIRVALSGTSNEASSTLDWLSIANNYAFDGSDSVLSAPFYISSQYSDKLVNVVIDRNLIFNKVIGIRVTVAQYLRLLNNTVTRHAGTRNPDNSKAYACEQISQLISSGNFTFGQMVPNTLPNCFLNGTVVTTIKEF